MNCQLCAFKNPKGTATAIIIKDNKLFLVKRKQEPFMGQFGDLIGGFMEENETPEQAMRRELKEELGVTDSKLTFINALPGTYEWKGKKFPVLSHFFLTEINDDIKLNKDENSQFKSVDLKSINPKDITFDSNQKMVEWLKEKFVFDIERVKELVRQLDSGTTVNEQSLYKAILNGFMAKKYDKEKLIGFGWIFPRQTLLRKQAVIEDMIIDENYRGKGYGKEILQELISWAEKEEIEVIELTSNPQRIAANELYKKAGFTLHPTNHYLYLLK